MQRSSCGLLARRSVDRCAYPDAYSGAWNMTETYLAPTILTRAHFFGADPSLANSTGNTFEASLEQHGWNYAVEHTSGLTIDVSYYCTSCYCPCGMLLL